MNPTIYDIAECTNCDLCHNQRPLLDFYFKGTVFWVGLSAVRVSNANEDTPLSVNTNSGNLINEIEKPFIDIEFYKTNLVKCLPLRKGKIRYPTKNEMKSCYSKLSLEIQTLKPRLVFLLGKQVASFIAKNGNCHEVFKFDDNFHYQSFNIGETVFVPIHHPSYILIFKRKRVNNYIEQIKRIIKETSTVYTSPSSLTMPLVPTH